MARATSRASVDVPGWLLHSACLYQGRRHVRSAAASPWYPQSPGGLYLTLRWLAPSCLLAPGRRRAQRRSSTGSSIAQAASRASDSGWLPPFCLLVPEPTPPAKRRGSPGGIRNGASNLQGQRYRACLCQGRRHHARWLLALGILDRAGNLRVCERPAASSILPPCARADATASSASARLSVS